MPGVCLRPTSIAQEPPVKQSPGGLALGNQRTAVGVNGPAGWPVKQLLDAERRQGCLNSDPSGVYLPRKKSLFEIQKFPIDNILLAVD